MPPNARQVECHSRVTPRHGEFGSTAGPAMLAGMKWLTMLRDAYREKPIGMSRYRGSYGEWQHVYRSKAANRLHGLLDSLFLLALYAMFIGGIILVAFVLSGPKA